jgi:hypothetical protein
MDKFDVFTKTLEDQLLRSYTQCEDFAATPSSILLSVLNAVAEARNAVALDVPTASEEDLN